MKRFYILSSILLIFIISLCACTEIISAETLEVDAHVSDVCYRGPWVQFIKSGDVNIPITHSAIYEVTFTYENTTVTIDSEDLYNKYKDQIGAIVKCDLYIEYYDNGSIHRTLIWKEQVNETMD